MKTRISSLRLVRTVFLIAFSTVVAACASIRTGSHFNETINFGAYKTFSWIDDVPYVVDDSGIRISPLTQDKIQRAIKSQLTLQGFSFIEEFGAGDFIVAFTVGTREKMRVTSYPSDYRGNWGWHVYGSHYYIREYTEHSYTEGTLGVDIFDGESKQPVWHGWAEKSITESDRKDPSAVILKGVAQLFESFPH
jgi:hypothetical protein